MQLFLSPHKFEYNTKKEFFSIFPSSPSMIGTSDESDISSPFVNEKRGNEGVEANGIKCKECVFRWLTHVTGSAGRQFIVLLVFRWLEQICFSIDCFSVNLEFMSKKPAKRRRTTNDIKGVALRFPLCITGMFETTLYRTEQTFSILDTFAFQK